MKDNYNLLVINKVYKVRLRLEVQTLTLSYNILERKSYRLKKLKWFPFHIPTAEALLLISVRCF